MKASNWLNLLLGAGVVIMAIMLFLNKTDMENTQEKKQMNSNAALDCIMSRTSIREYTDRQVPDSVVETLLKAGMAAPTAMNKQPWEFIVVTDAKTREAISKADMYIRAKEAPLVIIACGNLNKEEDGPGADFWVQDVSAATENILLAAHAQQLGAVWCGIYPIKDRVEALSHILGLPPHVIPLSAICIGYPKTEHHPKNKWNPAAVHYGKF